MSTHKIYTGIIKPDREADYELSIPTSAFSSVKYAFWFSENIVRAEYWPETGYAITKVLNFIRVEKAKIRYHYVEANGRSFSITSGFTTNFADGVSEKIDKARLDFLARKELENLIKEAI